MTTRSPRPTETVRQRPTWREVAAAGELPPLEGETARAPRGPIITPLRETEARRSKPTSGRETTLSANPKKPVPPGAAVCDYDERHRRIIDFRLPDLDGKPVNFKDLDADLVLLDFWGTWCKPCLRSTPHLVELQQRMEGKKLKIVGIACEQDEPKVAAARVAETAKKLNINYPILLSRNDGSCPLQEALHISAFPTMILVDREGRVLWRDQGATSATLARLDRILAATPEPGTTGRY
jgi:thiol-disulfide isomerase/thioredoxin